MPRWTDEAGTKQAELIAQWRPRKQSTGPRTAEDKSTSTANSHKYGVRLKEWFEEVKNVNDRLRGHMELLKRVRSLTKLRMVQKTIGGLSQG